MYEFNLIYFLGWPARVLEGLRSILNPLSSTVSLSTRRDEQPAKSDAARRIFFGVSSSITWNHKEGLVKTD